MAKEQKLIPYQKISISGKRLTLRPYKISDFRALKVSHNGRKPMADKFDRPLGSAAVANIDEFRERLARHKKHSKDRVEFIFGIFHKETGIHIGEVGFLMINRQLRWGNFGYHIQNQFTGRGYASEAGKLALEIGFGHLQFHRIEASMELDHVASRKVALSIGLESEGVRKKFFPANGGVDMDVYAANAIDYQKKNGIVAG